MDASENQPETPALPAQTPEAPSGSAPGSSPGNSPNVSSAGAPPPAASIVAGGDVSESSERAKRELEETRARLKRVEMDNMKLEDENKRLKAVTPPAPRQRSFDWLPLIR